MFKRILEVAGGTAALAALLLAASPASATLVSDNFGTAGNYAAIAGGTASSFTELPSATVDGNLAVTGSATILGTVTGTKDLQNAAATAAATDLTTALNALQPSGPSTAITSLAGIGAAGNYSDNSSINVSTNTVLNLSGNGTTTYFVSVTGGIQVAANTTLTINAANADVKIVFELGSFVLGQNAKILLGPDTTLDNVVFDSGSYSLGQGSVAYGNYLSQNAITLGTNATVCGRLLAGGSETLVTGSTVNVNTPTTTCSFRAVPEPASLGLMGGGLFAMAGFGWMAARRRKMQAI